MSLLRSHAGLSAILKRGYHGRAIIGKREVVGYGMNGENSYFDLPDFPFPAIRWREPDAKINALREKEKGDWKNLSLEEKKELYRYSYRQTFEEVKAPTGEWKFVAGGTMIGLGISILAFALFKKYIAKPLPESFSEEARQAQLERMLQLRVGHVDGISSKWDYENNRWK